MNMQQRNILIEPAEIPLPKVHTLISRIWETKKKNNKLVKDKLKGYQANFLMDKELNPNYNLIFYKFLPDIKYEKLSERKRLWLNELAQNHNLQQKDIPEDHLYKILKNIEDKEQLKEKLKSKFFLKAIEILEAATVQPLIVGLGETSPYETGITLDYLTGLPIIPGSAIKGITRRAAIMKLSGRIEILPYGEEFAELAKEYEKHQEITKVFGTQDQKGTVIFMDAYPVDWSEAENGKLFRLDVMNPHYQPYYENPNQNPPADWYNPVPVFYLTVNTRVKYRFVLASEDESALSLAKKWLEFALAHIGIGAKGNQGYGVFVPSSEKSSTS